MNMKQLRYVAVLAQHNNFTRAAEELDISQPSLSQYIRKIEKELGVDLFIRVGQEVRLTDAGNAYLEIGRKILSLENEMNNRLADISSGETGTLLIGIAPFRCMSLMPKVIRKFREVYPGIKVILCEQVTEELKESTERGKLDLCVSTTPVADDKFISHSIMKERMLLAFPKALCREHGIAQSNYQQVSIRRFEKMPFVSLPYSQITGKTLRDLLSACQMDPFISVECQGTVAAHAMVMEGTGVTLLPYSLVHGNEEDAVNYYYLEEETPSRELVVFYRKEQYLSKPMKKMIEILLNIEKESRLDV